MSKAVAVPSLLDLKPLLSPGSFLDSPADLATYSYDGALDRGAPEAVVLARDAEDVRKTVLFCAKNGVPFTARGAGTNLSGGCIPLRGGIVLSLARMNRILEVDTARGFALVEPGVVNGVLQEHLEKSGFFYAPDPASLRVSTIGGNIAENAGGPRCLKYGVTTQHVLAVEAVMPDGTVERFSSADPGCDMKSLLVGSEGTLGIVTKAWLKILPLPREIRTILAGFPSIDAAVECVSAIIAEGIVPRVLEAMDRTTVESVESFKPVGYPKAEAVLLIEVDGGEAAVRDESERIERLCRARGGFGLRAASDPAERERLWEGRRGAYAAMARLAPNVMVEDGVVPRSRLPEVVRRIQELMRGKGLTTGLLFHAGDGNIHPNVAYDERDPAQTALVRSLGGEILRACVELGGSLSGEHGIGIDKRRAMAWLFSPEALGLFRRVKKALDPRELANPDKLFPIPSDPPAGIRRPSPRALGAAARHVVESVADAYAHRSPMAILASGSRLKREPRERIIRTAGLNKILELDRADQVVVVEAGASVLEVKQELARQGFFLRLPSAGGTLGGLYASKAWPEFPSEVLGMRLALADGAVIDLGGKIVKNVAGYDLPRLLHGSWGTLAVILEFTLRVHASEPRDLREPGPPAPFAAGRWQRLVKAAFDPDNLLNPWLS